MIASSGYEGEINISNPIYSWTGEEPQTTLEYQIIPASDAQNARFIEANGELTVTLRIRWIGLPRTLYLRIAAYGHYQEESEFKVDSSNSVKITITLPL